MNEPSGNCSGNDSTATTSIEGESAGASSSGSSSTSGNGSTATTSIAGESGSSSSSNSSSSSSGSGNTNGGSSGGTGGGGRPESSSSGGGRQIGITVTEEAAELIYTKYLALYKLMCEEFADYGSATHNMLQEQAGDAASVLEEYAPIIANVLDGTKNKLMNLHTSLQTCIETFIDADRAASLRDEYPIDFNRA